MTPHAPFTVRRLADVPPDVLLRLMRSHEKQVSGVATWTREDVLLELGHPGRTDDDGWCLTGFGEDVLGSATVTARGDVLHVLLTVLPGRHGPSAARRLLSLALDRADALAARHGRRYAVTVGGVLSGDPVLPPVLREAGFSPGLTAGQYAIDLTAPPLPPLLPDGGALRPAGPGDVATLHTLHRRSRTRGAGAEDAAVFRACFDRLRESGGAALQLEVSGRPAGHVLGRVDSLGNGRVTDLAVDPAFRGLGIGYALLTAGLAELRARGAVGALVTLDTDDPYDPEALGRILTVRSVRSVTRFHGEAG
ncbi:GNAT family N-acetyltransferase [Streptomyces prasinosporus]